MNLTKIVEAVTQELRRPDLTVAATRAVRTVIAQVHSAAHFRRDLVEDVIDLGAPVNLVKFPLPPRFKDYHYLRPITPTGHPIALPGTRGTYTPVAPNDVMTPGGANRTNCYYVAGAATVLSSAVAVQHLAVAYWQLPDISNPLLESWAMAIDAELFILGAVAMLYASPLRQDQVAIATQRQYQEALQAFILMYGV